MEQPTDNVTEQIRSLLAEFTAKAAGIVEAAAHERVRGILDSFKVSAAPVQEPTPEPAKNGKGKPPAAGMGKGLCRYPGCKNGAAPVYGMFCAALHKGLKKKDKARFVAKWNAAHANGS